jgi:RNA polymerase sigma-70 factor (ECF subfamily)
MAVKSERSTGDADGAAETLGDLLYVDPRRKTVPESEWAALVVAIGAGDQHALQALYDRSGRIVFTLIIRIVRSREAAEELTLDVFHDVWRRAANYDPANGSVLGWILNQARSRAIDRHRFERRRKRVNPLENEQLEAMADDCEELAVSSERSLALRNALESLTADERQAVKTAYFSDTTYAEAAALLDVPVGTIKTRIRSALRKLRQALAGNGLES